MPLHENELIVTRNLEEEMKDSYLRYSMSVIISRALPDVRDGLKPSQRRILYAMRQLNLTPGAKHRKCAKICGDTSGDYHPHGESVIYPTLVRMAQGWAMRYPLVDGQGNFGSVDGDPPAAMRYTEARLRLSAVSLMEDLDKETVDMVSNYDETKVEPLVFPAKFPNLLCNGSSGIAVGMATNIPPHNLNELIAATLLVLKDKDVTIDAIMEVMPGPDFPTGGVICGRAGIIEAYRTGRGKLILRGVLHVEQHAQQPGRERIVIDELPYNVNKSRLVERIADLVNDKAITGLSDVRDESDKDGMRIVLELKRGEIPDVVINQLYKFTDMQVTFGCNMLALDKNLPRTMTIKQMIAAWVAHRIDVIRRRTRFELNKAEARAHILEGYLKAIGVLDEVVRVIRASQNRDEAKKELISRFSFTERQANAVLDLRLYQLTGLERDKIQSEYDELQQRIAHYRAVLASEEMVRDIIREELEAIQKQHKSPRVTQIAQAEGDFEMEDLIPDEAVMITLSEDDYVKRVPLDQFREQRRGGQGVAGFDMKKETDHLKSIYVASTHDTLLIFTNHGRCYWLKVWQLPEGERRAKGKPLINLLEDIQPGERVAAILRTRDFDPQQFVLMATRAGIVKKTELTAFSHPRRKGIRALEIDEGDELIAARLVAAEQQVMLFTYMGMAVRFDHHTVRSMGRTARGVKGVNLRKADDCVVGCEVVTNEEETILVVCENGFGKRSLVGDFRQTNRGGVGVRSIITSERNGNVVGAVSVTDQDGVLMISEQGQTVRIAMTDLRVMGRSTQGVKVVNLKTGDRLLALEKIAGSDEPEDIQLVQVEGANNATETL
ncbi:MAG: DNA topoisomerase (ATP-hydrolyzing) subunit A [Verrucomicrobia bacterium]|nr:DNA topoisomerase (ATP-hydrolyzing) subunit A [Verrucomicrobiota bacterium]MBS0647435.1 DNA topoisomerase (ATP-hydrolyzing) subunit A [Verrucomicrobiota bacterium]